MSLTLPKVFNRSRTCTSESPAYALPLSYPKMASSQGFEPRTPEPKSGVLPLHHEEKSAHRISASLRGLGGRNDVLSRWFGTSQMLGRLFRIQMVQMVAECRSRTDLHQVMSLVEILTSHPQWLRSPINDLSSETTLGSSACVETPPNRPSLRIARRRT